MDFWYFNYFSNIAREKKINILSFGKSNKSNAKLVKNKLDKNYNILHFRVLNKNGTAILQVPIDLEKKKTYEDLNIKTKKDRMEKFGQYDHVRIYGRDYFDRLERVGFSVEQNTYAKKFSKIEIKKYGIVENEIIPICKKINSK